MEIPDTITCIDCGETAHLLTLPSEDGWAPGDIVAYRCRGCHDRWDIVLEDAVNPSPSHDLSMAARAYLENRNHSPSSEA